MKKIKEFENYSINENGSVINNKTGRILKQFDYNGYLRVIIYGNNKRRQFKVHRLVAEYFIPNINNYKEVNHIDFDKKNNNVKNLEWVTRKENMEHASRNGLIKGPRKLTNEEVLEIRKLHSIGKSQKELSFIYNLDNSGISNLINKKSYKNV